jgi:ABC-type multidrug transport system ATPase subunit
MSLLTLENVGRSHRHGGRERTVLSDVSLRLGAGELVAFWGMPRSGRSTLLRVAAGIEPPDTGVIRLAGRDLAGSGGGALGDGIGYCQRLLRDAEAHGVLDALMVGQLARGIPKPTARARALAVLERVGASHCAARALSELSGAETVRAIVARALVPQPSLLVIDEPIRGVDLLERHAILALLRSLADEGIAILMSTGDTAGLSGADRALSLAEGELRGALSPELASVMPLRRLVSA